jgi:predicted nuclease of predicted toxin-antitoxin system
MKLLLDQNLSHKLIDRLSDIFPDSSHVKTHNLSNVDDLTVREFAALNDFTIVTQDSDFYNLALIHGIPPKVIWIRSGNSSTKHIEELMRSNAVSIQHFQSAQKLCLELF